MQMIGPFRKELRYRTDERCGRRSLKYVDGRKATNAAAARGQSLPLPRSGLVQQDLSVIRIAETNGAGASTKEGRKSRRPRDRGESLWALIESCVAAELELFPGTARTLVVNSNMSFCAEAVKLLATAFAPQ